MEEFLLKNSRKKVEKEVYQKFEVALIKKFNYIIDKKSPDTYLHGTQLANPMATLNDIVNQSGIVFYVPCWNVSNIDPVTGFVNLLSSSDLRYQNKESAKAFIQKIDRIAYEDGVYKFDIDFSNWNNRYSKSKTSWTLASCGKRVERYRNPHNNQWALREVDLTEEFAQILNTDGTLKSEDVDALKQFLRLFALMLQMRNTYAGDDRIVSPVLTTNNKNKTERLPINACANGAYNVARKGLMIVNHIKQGVSNPCELLPPVEVGASWVIQSNLCKLTKLTSVSHAFFMS